MTFDAILLLAAAVFIFSLKPGPGILTSISYSLSHGYKGLLAFLVGFNLGLGAFLTIVFIGFMGVNQLELDIVFFAIIAKSLAALYLITIGIKELRVWDKDVSLDESKIEKPTQYYDIVVSAIMLTVSNPMIIVFYASIIPAFITVEMLTLEIAMFITAMLMFIDSFGMVIYCAPVLLFRKKMSIGHMKYIRLVSAIIIILIGLYIGYTALPA
ncbi:MAG: LysE family translocator, partial [Polaribacter sp.]